MSFPLAPCLLLTLLSAADPVKESALAAIERQREALVALADAIWRHAETALHETRSAAALADYAEQAGFRVERGVAELPTAFVAEFGTGSPVIAILGEYDALPGISQAAVPRQEPLPDQTAGHGCGHNLFGAASLGAAVAVKERIAAGELSGTVRFYGTPAEESVGGKLYMVRAGLFDDVDVALAWHPSSETRSDTEGSQALVDFVVDFRGRAAHAAYDPWNGASALDGLEIFTFALNQLREHVRPTVRMHYVIQDGGTVPNVVPEHARVWCWMRDSTHEEVDRLLARARDMAAGAALAAGVAAELTVQSGDYEMLVNRTGQRLVQRHLEALGPIGFTAAEQEFAREIQGACGVERTGLLDRVEPLNETPDEPQGGSTDVADVSWITPTLHFSVTTAPAEVPWHAWPVVACSGTAVGHRGMLHAAKALATIAVELFQNAPIRAAIQQEFAEATAGKEYRGYLPAGPPPVPAN